jgi:hypothetical protein
LSEPRQGWLRSGILIWFTSAWGHSRLSRPTLPAIDFRFAPNATELPHDSETTRWAITGLMQRSKQHLAR